MKRSIRNGTGVFLMEMIMVVFFFILCASTCILVFVKSDNMSRLAKDTNQGVLAAESMAEIWKADGSDGLSKLLAANVVDHKALVYWTKDWEPTEQQETSAYSGVMTWTNEGDLEVAQVEISRTKDQKSLFAMAVARTFGTRN